MQISMLSNTQILALMEYNRIYHSSINIVPFYSVKDSKVRVFLQLFWDYCSKGIGGIFFFSP